ncbi:MAG: protein kinase [Vicinamibacterales bacterium]
MIGRTIGQYRIDARLGSGGMGVVYRAYDTRLQRTVALKVVRKEPSLPIEDDHVLEEARTVSALNHPNICTVYEVAEIEGETFIAMEYVQGRPLSQMISTGGLSFEDVVRYATEVADALAHAHERGVIHRDLKSANVAIAADGRAKVLDFGIARRIQVASSADTSSGRQDPLGGIPGTTACIAPEVLLGDPADARSDIWALGVLMFEMATGEMPFTGRNQFDLTSAILRAAPAALPGHVPVGLRGVIVRCLAKDPLQRYQRASEARAALEAIQSGMSPAADAPATHSRTMLAAIAGALVVAVAVGAWRWWPAPPPLSDRLTNGGRLSQVLSSVTIASDPSLSPDGKMVTFAAEDAAGRVDVYVARVAGGARIRLTNDDDVEAGPRFSFDGERVAFGVRLPGLTSPEIRVLPALGGERLASISNAHAPAWSRDDRLAYLRQSSANAALELVVSREDGSEAKIVLAGDPTYPFLRNPAWSLDGSELAVVRGTGGIAGEIWLVPVSGGSPRKLGDDPATVHSDWPSYAPDRSGILHASNRGGATNIWLYPRDGGAPVRITTGPGADEAPTIAEDGTIAFVNSRWKNALETYPLDGGAPKVLTSHMPFIWGPTISPDGKEVAFTRGEVDGSWHVWTVAISGGTPRRVTAGDGGEVYPKYLPNGSAILFHTWNAPRRIGRVAREGGPPEMLSFSGNANDGFADISPDGELVVFTRAEADAERLYLAPASGGPARLLTRSPGAVARWSPDGKSIAFGGTRGFRAGIFVIDADGKNERRITQEGGWPVWWPGKGIAFLVSTVGGAQEIRIVNPSTGSETGFDVKYVGSNHPFDISMAARTLVTSNGVHISDEIWLLEPRK